MRPSNLKLIGAIALVAAVALGRVVLRPLVPLGNSLIMFDLFALAGISSVLAGVLLGGLYSLIVPLAAMALSDLVLGNGPILIFTWSGFVMMGLLGLVTRKNRAPSAAYALSLTGIGIAGILAFDLWTNFGWWLLFYPHTLAGLGVCYAMALPFMIGHLLTMTAALPVVALPLLYLEKNRARVVRELRARLGLPAPT
ncbi:MAG: DUF6580 family putative transport protein [Thermoplasmata archaeon]